METLIDIRSTPYSTLKEIEVELERIRRLPASASRDHTIAMMQRWIDEKKATEKGQAA